MPDRVKLFLATAAEYPGLISHPGYFFFFFLPEKKRTFRACAKQLAHCSRIIIRKIKSGIGFLAMII